MDTREKERNESRYWKLEAASGFEPENNGFADRCLTSWLCRLKKMERETGFEPATSTLARSHSTAELFPLNVINYFRKNGLLVKGKKRFSVFGCWFSVEKSVESRWLISNLHYLSPEPLLTADC